MPNKKKKYSARFPPARIKKIMQKDDEVGKVAAAVPVIISRSLELFVESLIKKTNILVLSKNARTLTPQHIKQTVLLEGEFKFLHDHVSAIPDVQSNEDEQQPLQEVSAATRPTIEPASTTTMTATTTSSSGKPGGKPRGRPRKVKLEESKPAKRKKPGLMSNTEDCYDTEETCSGSEEENEELTITHARQNQTISSNQQLVTSKITHFLPSLPSFISPAGLTSQASAPSQIVYDPKTITQLGNLSSSGIASANVAALQASSKVALSCHDTSTPAAQIITKTDHQITVTGQHIEEALDLTTSGGKAGTNQPSFIETPVDMKVKKGGIESNFRNETSTCVPRTFYVTNLLNANTPALNQPSIIAATANGHNCGPDNGGGMSDAAYKLNVPKFPLSLAPASNIFRSDLSPPMNSNLSITSKPVKAQPVMPSFVQMNSIMSQPVTSFHPSKMTQNLSQIQVAAVANMMKEHQSNLTVESQVYQRGGTEQQFFGAGSLQFQCPKLMSVVPRPSYGNVKSPNSFPIESFPAQLSSNKEMGNLIVSGATAKLNCIPTSQQESCSSKQHTNNS